MGPTAFLSALGFPPRAPGSPFPVLQPAVFVAGPTRSFLFGPL